MKTILVVSAIAIGLSFVPSIFTAAQPPAAVSIQADKDQINFLIGKDTVTSYVVKPAVTKPYFWPVKAPNGSETTRAWPIGKEVPGEKKDHKHHLSVWFCHGDVIPEGYNLKTKLKGIKGVDFWTEPKGHGRIVVTKVEAPKNGPQWSSIKTHNEWRTTEGDNIMDEDRTITFRNFGKAYLIVLDIDLIASMYPITFGDTKEGTMAIRIHPNIQAEKPGIGKMQNAEGKIGEKAIWGYKSAWCDYSGKMEAGVVGVAILDDPANPFPAMWHARDYGMMTANPFGRDKSAKFPGVKGNSTPAKLAKGEHLHLRYGVVVHNGDAVTGNVEQVYREFVKMREANKK
ncbi:MAG TPA: PmoA family protein [Gemmataceae bacterium]|nr:PmoA family protein [Gemmataceae bacterium]